MSRRSFGGGTADFVATVNLAQILSVKPLTTITLWSAVSGGSQVTDLLVGGVAVTVVTTDAYGNVPPFSGPPDGTAVLWADAGGGARAALHATDTESRVSALESAPGGVSSVAGRMGAVTLAKADVGLGNVDNTADASKPVSTAQAAADALAVQKSANLSDLASAATARTNLGLGTAATQASSAFDAAGAAASAVAALSGTYVALDAVGHVNPSQLPRPALYAPQGLRRFLAALGDSLFTTIPLVVVGDSIVAGVGGNNDTTNFSNIPDNTQGFVGQLRTLASLTPAFGGAHAGEGFIFCDDSRITWTGSPFNNNWACAPLRHGYRMLAGGGWTGSLTVPAGVQKLGIIQGNQTQTFNAAGSNLADVSLLYSQTGSATVSSSAVTTLTNTGRPLETVINVQPGDVITLSPPASAQSYFVGFNLMTGNAGLIVHRIGQPGYVSGDWLGGQTSGTLTQNASAPNQTVAIRSAYDQWSGRPGLIIGEFGTNDQQYQAGGGAAAQNNATLARYSTWMQQAYAQAIADGWCCLHIGHPRNPNATGSGNTNNDYVAAMKAFALSTDHMTFVDIGELWASNAYSTALGLTVGTSVHPNRSGHGSIARMLHRLLMNAQGVTEVVAA